MASQSAKRFVLLKLVLLANGWCVLWWTTISNIESYSLRADQMDTMSKTVFEFQLFSVSPFPVFAQPFSLISIIAISFTLHSSLDTVYIAALPTVRGKQKVRERERGKMKRRKMNAADYAVTSERLKCVRMGLLSLCLLLLLVQFPWKLIPKHDSAHRKILRNKHSHANSIFSLSFSWHYLLLSLLLLMMMLLLMPLLLCSSVYLVFEFIRSLFAPEFPILLLFHLKAMNMSCLLSKRESGKAPQ